MVHQVIGRGDAIFRLPCGGHDLVNIEDIGLDIQLHFVCLCSLLCGEIDD